MNDEDRAMELAVYLNIETERWKRTQYEPVTDEMINQACEKLKSNQSIVQ